MRKPAASRRARPAPDPIALMPDNLQDDPRPVAPLRPAPNECCSSGCNPCIFELYEEALARHEVELTAWEARQARPKNIPGESAT